MLKDRRPSLSARFMMTDQSDQFEYWLFEMDDAIAAFISSLPHNVANAMDYSDASLEALESWLLSRYPDTASALKSPEASHIDGAGRYVGEVFRKQLGGQWFIDFCDPKRAFFGLPQLKGVTGQASQIAPTTLVTASLDRRTGIFLRTVIENHRRRAEGLPLFDPNTRKR